LGVRWELAQSGLRPYACGQANHGFIDAYLLSERKAEFSLQTVKHMQSDDKEYSP
jgi:hypothetical protein